MKIAIPSQGNNIDQHFGHCAEFTIVEINDDKSIAGTSTLVPPPGCGCKTNVVPMLAAQGVGVMLVGNIGQGAVNVIEQHGLKVVRGCCGTVQDTVDKFINGGLQDSDSVCSSHECS